MRNDWVEVELGQIGEVVTGGTPSKKESRFYNSKDYPFYKPTDLNNGISVFDSIDYLSKDGFAVSRVAPEDSILVTCIGATIGKTGLIKKAGGFNQQINAIIPFKDKVVPSFVYYQIISSEFQEEILKNASSTTLPIINKNKFSKLFLRVFSLPEQRAIVAKIDELFSELDNGIANLKAAQAKLDIYRQAVLKQAFEGELTREWREKQPVIPVTALGKIANIGTGATPKKSEPSYWNNGDIAWVTSGALNDLFVNAPSDLITAKAVKETNCKVFPIGTLLVAMYGEGKTRGKCSELKIPASTNQAIAAINLKSDFLSSKSYVKWFLVKNYNDIRIVSSGGVQPNLNLAKVKSIELPFPSIEEQTQIVQEIEARLSVCDKLAETIQTSLQQAEALRQSILKKAFEGRLLTETELQTCKAQADWMPAEQLLAQIKSTKAK